MQDACSKNVLDLCFAVAIVLNDLVLNTLGNGFHRNPENAAFHSPGRVDSDCSHQIGAACDSVVAKIKNSV